MTTLLIKKYIRSRGLMVGLLMLLIAGIISLHIGKNHLERHEATIAHTAEAQKEQIQRHLHHVDGHIGLLLYYIKFGLANTATPLSGLAIGHRDKRVPAQLVNIRNLEEQKNTQELLNPYYQLLGNMDLSFVIIYLFPLMIIGLGFNLWSEERESGTWLIVQSQTQHAHRLLRSKLLIRYGSVLLLLIILLCSAVIYLNIPIDSQLIAFSLIALLYVSFWFALVWFITSLNKSSNQNALSLLSVWIAMTIIIPGAVNNIVSYVYEIPEAYATTVESREAYHSKWDLPKQPTIEAFKRIYPQYSKYEHSEDQDFGWFWYYAMQHLGDVGAQGDVRTVLAKLNKRDRLSKFIGYIVPSIHTQLSMNSLAQTDLVNYLSYIEALTQFHEDKRMYFYPKVFDNMPIDNEDWSKFSLGYFSDSRAANYAVVLPLMLITILLLFTASFRWKAT